MRVLSKDDEDRNPAAVAFLFWLGRRRFRTLFRLTCTVLGIDLGMANYSGLILPHPVGIVIHGHVKFGTNVLVYQNVTIGAKPGVERLPVLGNDVTVYAGAVIFGPVSIGDGAVIGANSVVTRSVEAGDFVAGAPAKVISKGERAGSS